MELLPYITVNPVRRTEDIGIYGFIVGWAMPTILVGGALAEGMLLIPSMTKLFAFYNYYK